MDNTDIYLLIAVLILIGLVSNYFLSKNKRELERERNNKKLVRPEISEKNKWLFPSDGFGKMEKGRASSNLKDIYKKSKKY
jgi:hypothetical protein